ncbi:hypothetical protein FAZ15_06480 [Sphingobacterium olei]|uniref:DUF4466 domain-containing protein n=1 Tax=Sphingobacterium olei TaxID=2571155 RepID=A0A4U0P441_9SPHI|nr:hypothetical protein [Sphingobacterium olei]TJZ62151.1 hypothetical protein FAZ15_06480 [Sphingobacterium olei]
MKRNKILAFLTVITLATLSSCSVESENIFTMFKDVNVTFHDDSPYAVTDYKRVNDGDSVHISFTISSANKDMIKIVVDSTRGNGAGQVATREFATKEHERRSYSGKIKFKMARDGKTTFRIWALDDKNIYIGDGYKTVTVEGTASYTHLASRTVYAPWGGGDVNTFYSLGKGRSFNYAEGQANSADIDFGIYVLSDTRPAHLNRAAFNLYSISTPVNPLPEYDISSWEKRETLFSAPITGSLSTFNDVLASSSMIEQEAKKRTINLTHTNVTNWDSALGPGCMVYFLTPEGKYGALLVNQTSADFDRRPYLAISTKVQN